MLFKLRSRAVAKSPCAAFGGRERGGSEDTSRSARRLPPPGPLLLPELATTPSCAVICPCAAFGGRERGGSEDTSRSARRLPASSRTCNNPELRSDLEEVLRAQGITHLVLCGIATSGVVLSRLREAADKDYILTVLSDCCEDSDEEVQRVEMSRIFPRQAEVITTEE